MANEKFTLYQAIRDLKAGGRLELAATSESSARTYASNLRFRLGYRYKVNRRPEDHKIIVTRIA